jgi:hypothetical protein
MGQGLSQGLEQALEQARQERLRKERVQRQYQDLKGLSEALQAAQERKQNRAQNVLQMAQQKQSGGPPQAIDYNEIEQPGMSSREYAFNQYEPQTKFGVKLAQQRFGQQKKSGLSRGEAFVNDQGQRVVPLYDKQTGRKVKTVVLGKTQQNEDQWSEPYKKGNQWLQKNLKTNKVRKAYQKGGGSLSDEQRDEARLKKMFPNLSPTWREGIIHGEITTGEDKYGNPVLVNQITGNTKNISSQQRKTVDKVQTEEKGKQGYAQETEQQDTESDDLSFEVTPSVGRQGTGFWTNMKQLINNLSGVAGTDMPFEDTAEARNQLRIFNQSILEAVAANPRVPQHEQQSIREFLPDPNKVIKNPQEGSEQLRNLYSFVNKRIENAKKTLKKKKTSPQERKNLKMRQHTYENILSMFGEGFEPGSDPYGFSKMTTQELNQFDVKDFDSWSKEKLDAYLRATEG